MARASGPAPVCGSNDGPDGVRATVGAVTAARVVDLVAAVAGTLTGIVRVGVVTDVTFPVTGRVTVIRDGVPGVLCGTAPVGDGAGVVDVGVPAGDGTGPPVGSCDGVSDGVWEGLSDGSGVPDGDSVGDGLSEAGGDGSTVGNGDPLLDGPGDGEYTGHRPSVSRS